MEDHDAMLAALHAEEDDTLPPMPPPICAPADAVATALDPKEASMPTAHKTSAAKRWRAEAAASQSSRH